MILREVLQRGRRFHKPPQGGVAPPPPSILASLPDDTCPYSPSDEPLGTANDWVGVDESGDKDAGCLPRTASMRR